MFGKTDLTKIEKLLQRIIANQNKLLACWEDTPPPVAEPVKTKVVKYRRYEERPAVDRRHEIPQEIYNGTAPRKVNIEVSIVNYFRSKQAKTASTMTLISRFGGFQYNIETGKVLTNGISNRRLNTNSEIIDGILSLMKSRKLVAKSGVRLGRLSVLFGLPENIPTKKRITLTKTKAILKTTHPEDLREHI